MFQPISELLGLPLLQLFCKDGLSAEQAVAAAAALSAQEKQAVRRDMKWHAVFRLAAAQCALYFAILKVHPTPFCVMDEIEAALDESNVVRYARYMRRIAGKTQFIVITHRRGTMEEADVLYGITMQERGVSTVLTANLNELSKEMKIK